MANVNFDFLCEVILIWRNDFVALIAGSCGCDHGSGKSRVDNKRRARLMVFWETELAESRKVWKSVWASSED